jgi:hypothetical protein
VALKVGDLYVLLSAQTQGFGQGLQSAAQQLEQFTSRAKKAMREIGRAGRDMSIAIGAAIAIAAESNMGVAMELQKQKQIFATFANEIAMAMLPALREMGAMMMSLLGWWQQLNPETKASISHWVGIATAVGLAAGVFAKILGLLHGLLPLFEALGAIIATPLFLPIVLGLAGVAIGVALLHKVWRENWGGIQEFTRGVIEGISEMWQRYYDFVVGIWGGLVDAIAAKLKILIDLFAIVQDKMGNKEAFLQAGAMKIGIDAAAGAAKSPAAVGKLALEALKAGANVIKDEWLDMSKELRAKIKALFGSDFKAELIGQRHMQYEGPVIAGGLAAGRAGALLGPPDSNLVTVFTQAAHSLGYLAERMLATSAGQLPGRGTGGPGSVAPGGGPVAKNYDQKINELEGDLVVKWEKWRNDLGGFDGVLGALGDVVTEMLTSGEAIAGALKNAGSMFTAKLGKLGETINAGVQGFQNGGIWGAVIAVIMQFVTSAKGFTQIMNIGNGQFQMALNEMSKGLGDLFNGLKPLMGAIESIMHAIHDVLNPVFTVLGVILRGIAPILEVVGLALQVVAGTLQPLIQIIGGILDPIFKLLALTLTPLVMVFMALKVGVDYVKLGFAMLIDWIDHIVGSNDAGDIVSATADVANDSKKLTDFVSDWIAHPFDAINNLENSSANAAAALDDTATAAKDVSQQLLNVPQGFKVALAEFAATQAVGTSSSGSSSGGYTASGISAARSRFLMTGVGVEPGRFPRNK